jgi:hypothetical protein
MVSLQRQAGPGQKPEPFSVDRLPKRQPTDR